MGDYTDLCKDVSCTITNLIYICYIALGENFIHSYGRLVHSQQVFTRKEELLPPDGISGPGKMECTRAKAKATFALYGIGIGTRPATDLFYRIINNDHERDTLLFKKSNVDKFQNAEGFCTIIATTYFYLFLWPGEFPLNMNYINYMLEF